MAADATDANELRSWLLTHVCPFWFDRVTAPEGGFHEALDAHGQALVSPERSLLNQARLTYVASHAWVLGGDPRMLQAAQHGFAFLRQACAALGPAEGWPKRLTVGAAGLADLAELDSTRDAYDHAFVLFALAWYYHASGDPAARTLGHQVLDFMQARLADPSHGGFFEEYPQTGKLPRRQNPHMHLLEAVLAMHAFTGEARWLAEAQALVALATRRFLDPQRGALVEYFARDWSPAEGASGAWREPGHQFEWVWLLGEYLRQSGPHQAADGTDRAEVAGVADRLFAFGTRYGIDRQDALGGAVLDGVDRDGTVAAHTKLLWPQTEYIKALVQRAASGADPLAAAAAWRHMQLVRRHFFMADGANWSNQLARDGSRLAGPTPARVLYHVFLAGAELIGLPLKTFGAAGQA